MFEERSTQQSIDSSSGCPRRNNVFLSTLLGDYLPFHSQFVNSFEQYRRTNQHSPLLRKLERRQREEFLWRTTLRTGITDTRFTTSNKISTRATTIHGNLYGDRSARRTSSIGISSGKCNSQGHRTNRFLLDRNPKIERPLCEAFPQWCALTSGRAYDLRQRDAINWNYSEISSTSFVTDFHGRCENQRSLPKISSPYRGRFEATDISRSRRPFSLFDLVRIHAAV